MPLRFFFFAPFRYLASKAIPVLAIGVSSLLLPNLRAEVPDVKLQAQLEDVYAKWKQAFRSKDVASWAKVTSKAKQMTVRNTIVSLKREWPKSLFSLALLPPETISLRLVASEQKGVEARLIYFGKVDFNLPDGKSPPDNLLAIDFLNENGGWRYHGATMVNISRDPELRQKASRGDVSFLMAEQPLDGLPPAMPRACPAPSWVGQISVAAVGYKAEIDVNNGFHTDTITDTTTTETLMGGLQKGANPLKVKVTPLERVKSSDRSLEISVYAVIDNEGPKKARRILHFVPNNPASPSYDLSIQASTMTLKDATDTQLIRQ